jgi:hypothetical protein
MAHKRLDTFTKTLSWNKHLRPFGKRKQNDREKQFIKKIIKDQVNDL